MRRHHLALLLCSLAACDGQTSLPPDSQTPDLAAVDIAPKLDRATPAPDHAPVRDRAVDANGCGRQPAAADRERKVVVSHPYQTSGGPKVGAFEVLGLSIDGKLSKTGQTFQLGAAATQGEIVFTVDGKVGMVALEDGSIGVFLLDAGGPQVVHAALKAKGYATSLRLAPDGEHVYALSAQWRNVGGGIYRLKINCDGTLTDEGLIAASKLPYALVFGAAGTPALVVAKDVLTSTAGLVHLVDLATPTWIAGVTPFPDDEAIVSSAALTADGRYLLVADDNVFSTTGGNRVAAVEVQTGNTLRAAQVLSALADPAAVVTSPHNDTALVLDGEANKITVLDYDPSNASAPFSVRGFLATSSTPQLPTGAAMISRGALTGRVIVVENVSLRQVQLDKGGSAKESELYKLGSGLTAIPGAIGVQP
jgi:hypothetical protein